jgi:hypothetical protein
LLGTMFSIRSVQSDYKEEFQSSEWAL